MAQGAQRVRSGLTPSWLRITAAVALAAVAAVTVWLIVKDDRREKSRASPTATAVTLSTLHALPGELGHAVYWAGPRAGQKYELTQVDGDIFVRYLPTGIGVGDPRPDYLTIGTYPAARPYRALRRQAGRPGVSARRVAGAGIAVWADARPQVVYLAYRRSALKVEVYDPSAARARRLATSGAVEPIR